MIQTKNFYFINTRTPGEETTQWKIEFRGSSVYETARPSCTKNNRDILPLSWASKRFRDTNVRSPIQIYQVQKTEWNDVLGFTIAFLRLNWGVMWIFIFKRMERIFDNRLIILAICLLLCTDCLAKDSYMWVILIFWLLIFNSLFTLKVILILNKNINKKIYSYKNKESLSLCIIFLSHLHVVYYILYIEIDSASKQIDFNDIHF